MRAAVLTDWDSGFQVIQVDKPEPLRGEVQIKVAACGVCHTDLHVAKAEVAFPKPCVLGHEVSGVVSAVGPDVDHLAVGDRVVCSFIMPCGQCGQCAAGNEDVCETFFNLNRLRGVLYDGTSRLSMPDGSFLAQYSMGGLAEYCVAPASSVFLLPEGLDLHDAAVLGCSLFTAYGAVVNVARLSLGETVAVVAAGGIGLNIIQTARAAGARQVIAIDVADDKLEAARGSGATHVVNALAADPVAAVRSITGDHGVDVAFEALGSSRTFDTALGVLGDGGRAVLVGIAPAGVLGSVDITRVVRRKLKILGSFGARARTDMPNIIEMVSQSQLSPSSVISRRFDLDGVQEAYSLLASGSIIGRAVIDIS